MRVSGILVASLSLLGALMAFGPVPVPAGVFGLCALAVALQVMFACAPSALLTGERDGIIDGGIALAFAALSAGMLASVVSPPAWLVPLSLCIGVLLLLLFAVLLARTAPRRPGLLFALHPAGHAQRVVWGFVGLCAMYALAFTTLLGMLRSTGLLLVLVLLVAVLLLIDRRRLSGYWGELRAHGSRLLEPRMILLGVAGLLVLRLVADIGGPVLSALLGLGPQWALGLAREGGPLVLAASVLSVGGVFCVMGVLAHMWHRTMRLRVTGSHEHLPDWRGWQTGGALALIIIALLAPLITFDAVMDGSAQGFTPQVRTVGEGRALLALAVGACVLVLVVVLSALSDQARRVLMLLPMLASAVALGVFCYFSFVSLFLHSAILVLGAGAGAYLALPAILLVFVYGALLFISGYLSFLYEIWRD